MQLNRRLQALLLLAVPMVVACGGGGGGGTLVDGTSGSVMRILEVSNGFGKLLPYEVRVPDAQGFPTSQTIEITSLEALQSNVTPANPILPPTEWRTGAVLPNNAAGNHFLFIRFSQPIDITSVMTSSVSAGIDNQLTGNISVLQVDVATGQTVPVRGRGFVGGRTYGPGVNPLNATQFLETTWVTADLGLDTVTAVPVGSTLPGTGFPGTQPGAGFNGSTALVRDNVFCFVADTDNNLSTLEQFPAGVQLQVKIEVGVRSTTGNQLEEAGLASATVGNDGVTPEVMVAGAAQIPIIIPSDGEIDVDPSANIEITFSEPVQPFSLGVFDTGAPPTLSAAVQLQFGPSTSQVNVPFTIEPISAFDLSRYALNPIYNFPGSSPVTNGLDCGSFAEVRVIVNPTTFSDLLGNQNTFSHSTSFTTRQGTGLVNAPVVPDAIYVGRGGSQQAISVIDLNGFGQGTGSPAYDEFQPIREGASNFPNNPNLAQGQNLIPALSRGTCTFDGGSGGVFTLVKDTALNDTVAGPPLLETVGDMVVGHTLDALFNNSQPFGCQAGGGNICASTGLKIIQLIPGGSNTVFTVNANPNVAVFKTDIGTPNLVSWAPHPNPPPLMFPPLCTAPFIGGAEPTSIDTLVRNGRFNLLAPGSNPLGVPSAQVPPSGLLTREQNTFFEGPSPAQPNLTACLPYMVRQQIGHFLYVVDRAAGQIVVFNSNSFRVIDRIRTPDPTNIAISPNLDFLAVTNQGADQVTFIDADPSSTTFHDVVKTTVVGVGPTGITWESGNEDIFVCNQSEGTVSILSPLTLAVRKVLRNQISQPIAVATTPRQQGFGFNRGVYFAYILNQNGSVAFFESGPDGVNGIGFDQVIGSLSFNFFRPKAIQPDLTDLNSSVWIVHENSLDLNGDATGEVGGAITNVGIASGIAATIPLDPGPFVVPSIRDLDFGITSSFGEGPGGLSGVPVDFAFDNQRNLTAIANFQSLFGVGTPLSVNGKSQVKMNSVGTIVPTSRPQFMFVAVPDPGVVDVVNVTTGTLERIDTNPFLDGVQSISVPNVNRVVDYFRP